MMGWCMLKDIAAFPVSILCLFVAMIVYGLSGSPTPDNPGLPEILIGFFLLVGAGMGAIVRFRTFDRSESIFFRLLHVVFLVGLILPTATGIYNGNDQALILRDILAFSFLCLPLFVMHVFDDQSRARQLLPWLMTFVGAVFAIRTLIPAFNIWIAGDELLYLSNSPLVLFAAIFLLTYAWQTLTGFSWERLPTLLGASGAIAVILAAMLLDVQRATVAAIAISALILWLVTLVKTPRRIILPTLLLLAVGFAVAPWLDETAAAIYKKTSEVGLNMRAQEVEAVMSSILANPLGVFIGTGWGGVFASPAVGGLEVNYTHSLLSTMFLKGGIVLLVLVAGFCLSALHQIILIFQRDSGRGLALFWPFIIPVFLYASHKSLDFGLLLLSIGVWSKRPE